MAGIRMALLLIGSAGAVACGDETASSTSHAGTSSGALSGSSSSAVGSSSASTPEPTPTPTPQAVVGDTVTTTSGHTYQVLRYTDHFQSTNEFNSPSPGGFFAAIRVRVCAGPSAIDDVNSSDFVLQEPDDSQITEANSAGLKEPTIPLSNLPTGQCVSGWVNYDVLAKPKAVILQHSDLSWVIP